MVFSVCMEVLNLSVLKRQPQPVKLRRKYAGRKETQERKRLIPAGKRL